MRFACFHIETETDRNSALGLAYLAGFDKGEEVTKAKQHSDLAAARLRISELEGEVETLIEQNQDLRRQHSALNSDLAARRNPTRDSLIETLRASRDEQIEARGEAEGFLMVLVAYVEADLTMSPKSPELLEQVRHVLSEYRSDACKPQTNEGAA